MENKNLENKKIKKGKIVKKIITYAIVYVMVVWIFDNVLMLNIIPSESMENTIMTGDIVISTRYNVDSINRYDIVVFDAPEGSDYYIKRVIGLPGETITVKNGKVYADGNLLEDTYIAEKMDTSGDGTYKVPKGCYFMMGDNRNNSNDSRYWDNKYVEKEKIVAKATYTIFPISNWKNLDYKSNK